MIRTKTLDQMVTMLRAECGESTNASMGINTVEGLYQILRRTQEGLWDEFDFGTLPIDTDEPLLPGENLYTFNDAIDNLRIQGVWVNTNDSWIEMEYGISPVDYNASDPEADQRETTPVKWMFRASNQFEVWPRPSVSGTIRFRHIPVLADMINGASMGTLDANLIVLFAAAERLASKKDSSAPIKLEMAKKRLAALRYNSTQSKITPAYAPRNSGRSLPENWEVRVPRTA